MSMMVQAGRFATPALQKWRVRCVVEGGGGFHNYGCSEIEMRSVVGGVDLTGGGTASSSGNFSGAFPASNAFDNNTGTDWASSASGAGDWIGCEFLAAADIAEVLWRTRNSTVGDVPAVIAIDKWNYSTSAWDLKWYDYFGYYVSTGQSILTSDVLAGPQAWRVLITAIGGVSAGFSEIEMRASPGGADECSGGYAFAINNFSTGSFGPANAFDNNNSTEWASANGTTVNGWIGYRFAQGKDIREFALRARGGGSANNAGYNFSFQYFDKATNAWVTSWTDTTPNTWSAGETRVFTRP